MSLHVCLAGRGICDNWELIRMLKERHDVTLVPRPPGTAPTALLAAADVLAVDCGADARAWLDLLPALKRSLPGLCVVLVDGGLNLKDLSAAFGDGARDYFSDACAVGLLAERLEVLGRSARFGRA